MKILSVDDQVENLYLLESMLKGAGCGYEVVSAHNGVDALHKLEQEKFDLIISDILMPQMDGFELCHQVKQREEFRHMPFIFYTATYTDKKDEELAIRLGASRFIVKPIEPDNFLAIIQGVIREFEAGRVFAPGYPPEKEEVLLKAYNDRLVQKLDKKVQELESELIARRKAEEQIRLQAAALESAANSIIITDAQGVVHWVNAAFERLTGYSAAEALGQTTRFLKSGLQTPEFFTSMWETLRNGQVWRGELVNRRKNGSLYHEEMTVTPVRGNRGEITHFIAIKQDISERKQAEEALRQAREDLVRANAELERKVQERTAQLVEANANLETFTYTAAHDLRSPLRGIKALSTVVVDCYGEKLGLEGGSLLERVVGAVDQMQRLLNDLLEYSKMSQEELKLEPVELRKAINEALALLDEDIRGKNGVVTVKEPLPEVIGHLATVVLLIKNFISNALKFMTPGVQPRIRIWAERGDMDRREASTPQAPTIRIWVEDNGIGIAQEDLERIFGAFERLHNKQSYPGTGLGLAIVRKGAKRMGGQVGVESEPGKGSRFWVELRSVQS